MENKKNFLTRGFSPLLILIFIFIISSYLPVRAYWHQVFEYSKWTSIFYNVVGDSSVLYAGAMKSDRAVIVKSTDLGMSWNNIYNGHLIGNSFSFTYYVGLEYPSPGYMYFLYSSRVDSKSTGIKRFDERTGEILDSIVISKRRGYGTLANFSMYDSLNGIYFLYNFLSLTRDGWKNMKQYGLLDSMTYGDGTGFDTNFTYTSSINVKMIDKNTVFFFGYDEKEYLEDPQNYDRKELVFGFYKMIIGKGDSTFSFEALGDGINLEISKDSIHHLTANSNIAEQKYPISFSYINDSTWLYISGGKKTGYGQVRTLEIFKTINRGETFRQVCLMDIGGFGLQRISFKDELQGLAVGNGTILRTSDGGETWTADIEETHFFLKDWTKDQSPHWNINISYVDGMSFLGMYNVGVYKYEDSIGTVGVVERPFLNNSLLFPNPIQAGRILNFKIPQLISGRAFIFDIYGNKVDEINFFGNSIQLRNDIVAGTYFLVIGDVNEKIIARVKFIVK